MKEFADGLWRLDGFPPNGFNAYLMGDVLIDAGTRRARRRILRQLKGREVAAHALTHAHFDHQGSSHAVCEELEIPLLCPEGEADAMEGKGETFGLIPENTVTRLQARYWAGPAHPVARRLREGDEVAGFQVLETPGHSPGHVVFWRESDRVLVAGDVLNGMNLFTGLPGLHEPPRMFTVDPERNRESIRRIAGLEPALTVFGHGPPCRDPAKLAAFAEKLPACAQPPPPAAACARSPCASTARPNSKRASGSGTSCSPSPSSSGGSLRSCSCSARTVPMMNCASSA